MPLAAQAIQPACYLSTNANNEYLISAPGDLIIANTCPMSATYRVTADIDAKVLYNPISYINTFIPLGSNGNPFTGTFHGGGHTIKNLVDSTSTAYTGFFGYVGSTGVIDSLHIDSSRVLSNGYILLAKTHHAFMGGLAGYSAGTISYSSYHGSVTMTAATSNLDVGGLVGHSDGVIKHCNSMGTVRSYGGFTGGLVGGGSEIDSSYSASAVVDSVGHGVGGLVGYDTSTVRSNFSTGSVNGGAGSYVGGLVGILSKGLVISSFSQGNVNGGAHVGGLVGLAVNIDSSWSTGAVTGGGDSVGGLVGSATGSVKNSFSTSTVTGTKGRYVGGLVGYAFSLVDSSSHTMGTVSSHGSYVGGLVGYSADSINNSFSTDTVKGDSDYVGGLVGFITQQIRDSHSKTFVSGVTDIGGLAGVTQVVKNSYSVGSVSGYQKIGGLAGDAHDSIVNTYSKAQVKGTSNYVGGLIGYATSPIVRSHSTGSVQGVTYVGGLVGNGFSVDSSFSTGAVSGTSAVGGLVGYSPNASTIKNSYSTGPVNATGSSAGGLVGEAYGTISNSYSTSAVHSTSSNVGGLVGTAHDLIVHSYSSGFVAGNSAVGGLVGSSSGGSANYSYWNSQTSNQTSSAMGTYNNTAAMMVSSDFSFWDFTTPTIWTIVENKSYPALTGLNNAPFAYDDSLVIDSTGLDMTRLLANDIDADKTASSLIVKVDSLFPSTIFDTTGAKVKVIPASAFNTLDSLIYRIGEISFMGDTLWGNQAKAKLFFKHDSVKLTVAPTVTYGDGVVPYTSTAESGMQVVMSSSDTSVATFNAGFRVAIKPGTVTLTASQAGNSIWPKSQATATLTVNPKSISITNIVAANKEYDGTTTATITSFALNDTVSGDKVQANISSASFASKNVGMGISVNLANPKLTGKDAAKYTLLAITESVSANITAKAINVTATADTITRGDAAPTLTYVADNLLAGESFSGSLSRIGGDTAGTYAILIGTLSAGDNYTINFKSASLVIQAPVVQPPVAIKSTQTLAFTGRTNASIFNLQGKQVWSGSLDVINGQAKTPNLGEGHWVVKLMK